MKESLGDQEFEVSGIFTTLIKVATLEYYDFNSNFSSAILLLVYKNTNLPFITNKFLF